MSWEDRSHILVLWKVVPFLGHWRVSETMCARAQIQVPVQTLTLEHNRSVDLSSSLCKQSQLINHNQPNNPNKSTSRTREVITAETEAFSRSPRVLLATYASEWRRASRHHRFRNSREFGDSKPRLKAVQQKTRKKTTLKQRQYVRSCWFEHDQKTGL